MARTMSVPGGIAWAVVVAATAVVVPQAGAWQGAVGGNVGAAGDARPGVARASCVVMLRGGTGMERPNGVGGETGTFAAAMTSTELVDPAAKAALGLGPDAWPAVAQVELAPAGDRSLKLIVTVAPGEKGEPRDEAARHFLREMLARAEGVVARMSSPRRGELKAKVEALEKRVAEAKAGIAQLRTRRDASQSPAARASSFNAAQNSRQNLEVQLARSKPRLDAIKAVLPKAQEEFGDVDSAARDLVAAREAVANALAESVEKGEAGRLELLRARADVAEARAKLAEGGRGLNPSPFRRYRDELTGLEVEVRVLEAQIAALPPEPPKAPDGASAEDPLRIQVDLSRAENELSSTESQAGQARRELESLGEPFSLVILDGKEAGR